MASMCYLACDDSWESKLRATASWGSAEFLAPGFAFTRPGPPAKSTRWAMRGPWEGGGPAIA
eukprot:1227088-Pyramimonas_sp.AAC.1